MQHTCEVLRGGLNGLTIELRLKKPATTAGFLFAVSQIVS